MKKIFISIPITGQEEASRILCAYYQKTLSERYPDIEFVSPFNVCTESNQTDAYYLGKDIHALLECDAIVSADGWQRSKGCQLERFAANLYGLRIFDMNYILKNKLEDNIFW